MSYSGRSILSYPLPNARVEQPTARSAKLSQDAVNRSTLCLVRLLVQLFCCHTQIDQDVACLSTLTTLGPNESHDLVSTILRPLLFLRYLKLITKLTGEMQDHAFMEVA